MPHVFISYARSDEDLARGIGDLLTEDGFEVWRDDELPAHRAYAEVIQERLTGASAVVVLWSAEAIKSQWVRAEADSARAARTLIQVSLDGIIPPIPFNQIQCADFKGWDRQRGSSGWRKLVASVAELAGPAPERAPRKSTRTVSICVLPFQNMSGDAEQEYFSDGISEDITTDLSKISALEVIARNTAFTFKGQSVNVCDAARKLGVTHVLEGSVRKAGDRVRITAQLIDGATGGHVWADRYDRDLTDIFTIQDEISKAIVEALKVKLLPEEKKAIEKRGTQNAEAYNLYLLARDYWITGNHGDPRREERGLGSSRMAVVNDGCNPHAFPLLALAQSSLHYTYGQDIDDGFAAANAALSIDPTIAEAHLPMFKRLQERQKHEEAAAKLEIAISLGADSWSVNKEAGRFFLSSRQDVPTATRHYEKATELMETDFHAWAMLASCYLALGEQAKVGDAAKRMVSEAHKAVQQDPSNGAALGILAGGYAILGQVEKTREWIDRALLIDPDNLTMRYNFACILAANLHDKEAALKMLSSTLPRSGAFQVMVAATDTDFASIRDDPRFQKMIADAKKRHGIKDDQLAAAPAPDAAS
jgi:adenylate cyclase